MSEVVEENKFKVDYNNIKTVDVKKSKSKFVNKIRVYSNKKDI